MLLIFILVMLVVLGVLTIIMMSSSVSAGIKKHKHKIEAVYIATSLLTIGSIVFAMVTYYEQNAIEQKTYYEQKAIEQENKYIILENLAIETDINLEFIDYIQKNKEKYQDGGDFFATRYNYFFMEQSLNLISNKSVRKKMTSSLSAMTQQNSMMNHIDEILSDYRKSESGKELGIKNENFQRIIEGMDNLQKQLLYVKYYLNQAGIEGAEVNMETIN